MKAFSKLARLMPHAVLPSTIASKAVARPQSVPAIELSDPDDSARRKKLLTVISWGMGLMGLQFALMFSIFQKTMSLQIVSTAVPSLLIMLNPTLMRRGASLKLAGSLLLAELFIALTLVATSTGGFNAPVLIWFLVIPLIAIFLFGTHSSIFWTVLVSIAYITFYGLDFRGLATEGALPEATQNLFWLLAFMTVLGFLLLLGWYYETSRQRSLNMVKQSLEEMKALNEALREARDEAEKATKAKSEFLANMSHEIRTPLNGVIGMTSLLFDTTQTQEQQEFTNTIRSSGDALLTIINDILDFSKVEAGKMELEEQPFSLQDCVEDVIDLLAPKALEKELELFYLFQPAVPLAVRGDVTRLRQILLNLMSNAVKFTEQGEILVGVDSQLVDNGRFKIHFSVKDTGIGIPPEKMQRLFKSFSQVDSSTTRKYGGTGLGLTISKMLVELMGGRMWVESKANEGSTFHFNIEVEQANLEETNRPPEISSQLDGKRILIVDDNETNRFILSKQTESWGMLPVTAVSGLDALTRLKQGVAFDLAILDFQMPEMDGLTLANKIRDHFPANDMPLVMLTSLGANFHDGRKQIFDACLSKPVKPNQLYQTLATVLEYPERSNMRPTKTKVSGSTDFDNTLGQTHPLRILVAEDNLINQKVALRMLERMGYRADIAANGLEAVAALHRQPYDLIFMDVQMPEMDGVEATIQIKQEWPTAQHPTIVAMTANALDGEREKYLAIGMDDYISKPVRPLELAAVLKKYCVKLPETV